MNYVKRLVVFVILGFTFPSFAEDINDQSFNGQWCGKWDNVYDLCIEINGIADNTTAIYRWKEFPNGHFSKSDKQITRLNRNTLKIGSIFMVLDENDLSAANAVGIFKNQSRIATLEKQSEKK